MSEPTPVVVLPPVSEGQVAADLRWLTRLLVEGGHAENHVGGVLGGEYGYGTHFANDVFEMHPYYWGDCRCGRDEAEYAWSEAHDHAPGCYQQVIRARGFIDVDDPRADSMDYQTRHDHNDRIIAAVCAEMGLSTEAGTYVHCACTHDADYAAWVQAHPHEPTCGIVQPNFRHKPTGSTVCFYKYLGRGMEVDLRADWRGILAACAESLPVPTGT